MPTINFPSGPSLNDSYNLGTRTWKWNGEAWALQPLTGGFTGSAGAIGYTGSTGAIAPLTIDTTNDRVGINQTSPSVALDVVGGIKATGKIETGDTELNSGSKSIINTGTSNLQIDGSSNGARLYIRNGGVEGFSAGSEGGQGHGSMSLRGQQVFVGGNGGKGFAIGRSVSWSDVNSQASGEDDLYLKGDVKVSGSLRVVDDVTLSNNKKVIFGDAGENIVGDGTNLTIVSSGNAIIDATGHIDLDYGGIGNINLKDDGTKFATFGNNSGNFNIDSAIQDKDISFRGNDGGSSVTALTLDMSDNGAATFSGGISITNGALTLSSGVSNSTSIVIKNSSGTVLKTMYGTTS